MKKGLLSLLVVALTVVGCQDYDDQFDSLNQTIVALQADVTTMKGITTAITALDTQLKALEGKVLQDGDLADITSQILSLQTAINAIEPPADVSGIEEQVLGLNGEIDDIIAALGKLTKAGQTYAGNINIRNFAELEIAEAAFGIDPAVTDPDPMGMNITGNVFIDADNATLIATPAILARLQVVMNSIKTAGGNLDINGIDNASTLPMLSFVGGTASFEGTSTLGLGALTSVISSVSLDISGAIDYPSLASAASVQIATTKSVTSVNLVGLTTGDVFTTANNLSLPDATSVIVYSAPASVTLPLAVTVQIHDVAANTGLDLAAPVATSVVVLAASITGAVTITANAATVDLSSANLGGGTISAAAINADTATTASATTLSATTISLAALTTIGNGGLTYNGPASFSSSILTGASGNFTSTTAAAFTAPAFSTSTGTIQLAAGLVDVSVLSINATARFGDYNEIANLTLAGQLGTLLVTPLVNLVTLNYTGDAVATGDYANDLAVTAANTSLTTIVFGDDNQLESFTATGTPLKALTTNGVILDLDVSTNVSLTTLSFGHSHLDKQDATTVKIIGNTNPLFVTVDMSSLAKVKTIEITGNTSLTAITPPSATVLAEPTAAISVSITGNLLQGTYTESITGTDTTPAAPYEATSTVITAFKVLIDAYDAQATRTVTATYDLLIDQVDTTGTAGDADALFNNGTFAAQAGTTGNVDTAAELAIF